MKKLLSICFLSILLALLNVPVQAQTTQSCCFWLENLQPQTLHDIANVPGGGAAHLPGTGGDVVLNNTMNPVLHGIDPATGQCQQTDYYKIRFANTCNLPATTKVSIEWKLYRDGQLVNGNLSDYADFRIYTRYGRLHNSMNPMSAGQTYCDTMGWIGGRVSGLGTCLYNTSTDLYPNYPNYDDVYCAGGYPGATEVEPLPLDFANESAEAWGYTYFANEMGLDYFNLPFFEATDHVIVICWKQVGNYSLVVGLRERTGGTDWGTLYWDENQQHAIGGHQSCCGALLAQDSIHYLVQTNKQKAVCDGETWDFGSPVATFSVENHYHVIFGDSVCGHFRVDSLVQLDFYTRINPDIIADDFEICVGLPLTADQVAAHTPAVNTDAPGIIDYAIWWSQDGETWTTTTPSYDAVQLGGYTWYVKQINHYDAVTPDDFYCEGKIDTLTITVLPLYPPVIDPAQYEFCYSQMPTTFPIPASYDDREECATGIVWQYGTTNLDTVADGASYPVAMTDYFTSNVNKTITFNVFTTNGYANSEPTVVTIVMNASPVLVGDNSLVDDTLCPRGEELLKTQFSDSNIGQTNSTISYSWTLNGTAININTASITGTAPDACSGTNVYVVTAIATSEAGCMDTLVRTFKLTAQDTNAIVVTPKPTTITNITVSGCDTTAQAFVAGRRTVDDLQILLNIIDHCENITEVLYSATVTTAECEVYVDRTYILKDECGNVSNPYVEHWTIKNDFAPVINGELTTIAPVPVQNCQFQVPAYNVLLNAFNEAYEVNFECAGNHVDHVEFYLDAAHTTLAPMHLIFEESDTAYVYAIATDKCGNESVNTMVFMLQRPPRMVIDGGILAVPADICLHDTVFLSFDTSFVHNATPLIDGNGESYYNLEWTANPNDGSIIYHTSPTAYGVPATANTDYTYTIHVTDYYGCVDSIAADPVHVHGLPTVEIEEIILNGSTFPLCPNYGNLTIHSITEPGNGGEIVRHIWSGESVNLPLEPNMDTTFVTILPDSCNKTYTAYLTVLNNDGCKASTSYSFDVVDSIAPVVGNVITELILDPGDSCLMTVPNLLPYFNNNNVSDNCYGFGYITITQSVAAGSKIAVETPVVMTLTDRCGNATTHTITLKSSAPLAVTITADEPEICQGETVHLTTTVENAVVPVIYTWTNNTHNPDLTVNPTEANHVYTVTVTDNIGCQAAGSIDILVHHTPVAADVILTQTANTYCENEDGIYDGTISAAANHADLVAWRMSGENVWHDFSYVYTGLQEGTYYFDLLTEFDCESDHIASIVVGRDTNVIVPITTTTPNAWCVAPFDGSITITNPQMGYTYEIINLPNSAVTYEGGDMIYDNLIYGHYSIHVTTDKYCTYVKEDVIVDSTRIYPVVATVITPKTRCDEPDGTITITNAMPGYTYTINDMTIVGTPAQFTGLNNGSYTLTAVSDYGCAKNFLITVNSTTVDPVHPAITVVPNSVCDPTITANGSITISQPIAGYTYTLNGVTVVSDGSAIQFNELGTTGENETYYTLTITDELGCTSVFTDAVPSSPFKPVFNNEITVNPNVNCEGTTPNGSIVINEEAGYTYYTYTLMNQTPMLLAATVNLPAGQYRIVKVHDATGCEVSTNVNIVNQIAPYNWAVSLTPDQNCDLEAGNGTITVTSATDNFIFLLADEDMELVGQNTNGVFVALNSGDYYLAATNTNTTCVYDTVITIGTDFVYPQPDAVAFANYNCKEEKNGTIVVTNSGDAVLPLTYTLIGYASQVIATNNTGIFNGLNEGNYAVYTSSAMNCGWYTYVQVVDSAFLPPLVHHQTPNTMCAPTFEKPGNGTIIVTAPMDTNFIYYFENSNEPNVLDTVGYFTPDSYVMYWLTDDLYTIHVYDPLTGCSLEDTAYVPHADVEVTFDPEVIANVNCEAPYTGIIIMNATSQNPDADLVYSIDNENFYSNNMFQNLAPGVYTIYVKDLDLDCSYASEEIVVENNNEFAPDVTVDGPTVICLNAEAQLVASATSALDGDTVFTYSWYSVCNGTVEGPIQPIYTGHTGICTYELTVTSELTGCTTVITIDVEVEPNPAITFLVNQEVYTEDEVNICHNDFPINLGVDPTNLVSYLWSNQVTESNFDVTLPSGNYCFFMVTVTDQWGCQNVDSIGVFSMPTYNLDVMDSICTDAQTFASLDSTYADTLTVQPEIHPAMFYTWVDSLQSVYGCDSVVYHNVTVMSAPTIEYDSTLVTVYCAGQTFVAPGYTIVENNSPVTESGWLMYDIDNQDWLVFDTETPLTRAQDATMLMPYAINACGESYSEPINLVVNDVPTIDSLTLNCEAEPCAAEFCAGDEITDKFATPEYDCRHWNVNCETAWVYAASAEGPWTVFDSTVTSAMNGLYVAYQVSNECGSTVSNAIQITVDSVPQATITPVTVCAADGLTVEDLNLTYTAGNTATAPATSVIMPEMPDGLVAGTYEMWVEMTNKCGTDTTNHVTVTVNDVPNIAEISQDGTCVDNFSLVLPNIVWNGNEGDSTLVMLNEDNEWEPVTVVELANVEMNGVNVRYVATNECGSDSSNIIEISIIDVPEVTLVVEPDTVCQNGDVELTATANWNNGDGDIVYEMSEDGETFSEVDNVNTMTEAGTFYFRATASNKCAPDGVVSNVVTVVVEEAPVLNPEDTAVTVCNNATDTITVTTNKEIVLTGAPEWITLEGNDIVIVPTTDVEAGDYTFTLSTVETKCDAIATTITVHMNAVPVIETFAVAETLYCFNDTISTIYNITWNAEEHADALIQVVHGEDTTAFVAPYTISMADTNLVLLLSATNDCGTTTQAINVNVSLPVELVITGVDTCAGLTVDNFVPVPDYTLYGATQVVAEGWTVDGENVDADYEMEAGMHTVSYYVTTQCQTYESNVVELKAFDEPFIVDRESVTFEICEGQTLTDPELTYELDGATLVSETWTINGEELDWTIPYDTTYNNASIKYIVETACGADTATWTLTVHALPVPEILGDTIICHDGSTELRVSDEYETYQWYMNGEEIDGATQSTYTVSAEDLDEEDASYTFTVVVTDEFGCQSTTSTNGSYQAIDANEVTVQVTNSPRFIFKYAGNETHYIDGIETLDPNDPSALNNNLVYTWEVFNPCFNDDTLVYVTFDIYHNDTLIDNATIGDYLSNAQLSGNYNEFWNTSIEFSFEYGSAITHNTQSPITRYNKAQAGATTTYDNHFPYSTIFASSNTYDDFYLHFLADNVYTQTIRPFRIPGEYKIIYKLYATSNTNTSNYVYYSESIDADEYPTQSRIIGGYNALVASAIQTLLATDSLMITVEGENTSSIAIVEPTIAPVTPTNTDEPTMNIYPNPTASDFTVEINGLTGETTIQIVNLTGSVLSADKVNIPATSKYVYRNSAENLAPGVYFMYIINDNATLSKKLVVRK